MIEFGYVWQGRPQRFLSDHVNVINFPGGETHVSTPSYEDNLVMLRGADPREIIQMMMFADGVRRKSGHRVHAIIPYLPGARQDRDAPLGAAVYADMINSCGFTTVWTVDPHSDVMPALIDNLRIVPFQSYVSQFQNVGAVIAPDAGATKRAAAVARTLEVPLYQAWKTRNPATGQLSGFGCEDLPYVNLLVVDDICDGGGTFIGLADHIGVPKERLSLWVTHGIFSAGFDALLEKFGHISFGNTWQEIDNETLTRYSPQLERVRVAEGVAYQAADYIARRYNHV